MLFRLGRPAIDVGRCQAPPGERIYAIGDVHGRSDLLAELLDRIAVDDDARPSAVTTIILLGDLINRGPDGIGALRLVQRSMASGGSSVRCLKGNHEEVMLRAVRGDRSAIRLLRRMGAAPTLEAIGITPSAFEEGDAGVIGEAITKLFPADLLALMQASEDVIEIGDYAFVHAGIRPGIALSAQRVDDLRWIREPFLQSTAKHEKMIVHGHTPSGTVQKRRNRIGVDTAACFSGRLSAIGLEGVEQWVLETRAADRHDGHGRMR